MTDQLTKQPTTIISTVGSVLAVDIGSLYTRAAIFDVVGDEYRYIARTSVPTTAELPGNDITVGLMNAVADLEQITGRKLTDQSGLLIPQRANGSGLDLLIATSSAAPALRLVVAAVSGDISEISASQAAQSTYTQIVSRITLDEGAHEMPAEEDALRSSAATAWLEKQTEKLLALPPDVVLMAGGVDDGPVAPLLRLAQVVSAAGMRQAAAAEKAAKAGASNGAGMPAVIFAGNNAALDSVRAALAPVREVRPVANVRPTLDTEQIGPTEAALATLYHDRLIPNLPGYSTLSRMIEGALVPTAECERLIARYLHAFYSRETLIADVGATSTALFLANSFRDQAVVLGDIGLAHGLGNLLAERGAANVLRWLPFEMSPDDLTDWALNKVIRPLYLPQTARDLAIEHAFAREALAAAAIELHKYNGNRPPRYDLLVGTGGCLANVPRPGQAALVLLDALQPTAEGLGSVELAIDTTLLIPPIGNLARHQPAMAAAVFDRDCLVWLGTAIVVQGGTHDTAPTTALTVTIERKGGESNTIEVPYGEIAVVPLRSDQRASLTVKPAPGFSVGGGEAGKPLKTQPGQEVKGGLVGLIIDARGRPMHFPGATTNRYAAIRRWLAALDAVDQTAYTGNPDSEARAPLPVTSD